MSEKGFKFCGNGQFVKGLDLIRIAVFIFVFCFFFSGFVKCLGF